MNIKAFVEEWHKQKNSQETNEGYKQHLLTNPNPSEKEKSNSNFQYYLLNFNNNDSTNSIFGDYKFYLCIFVLLICFGFLIYFVKQMKKRRKEKIQNLREDLLLDTLDRETNEEKMISNES